MRYLMTKQLTQNEMEEVQLQHMTKLYMEWTEQDEETSRFIAEKAYSVTKLGEIAAQEAFYESKYGSWHL